MMSRATALAATLFLCASRARGESTVYTVDAERSRLRLELGRAGLLKVLGHDHTIEAPVAFGRIEADPSDLAGSRVVLRFEARRLAIVPGTEPAKDIPEVESRMRGSEVLDVEHHPQIVFTSSSIIAATGPSTDTGVGARPGGTGETLAAVHRLHARGTLEIKGRPTEVEVPLEVRSSPGGLVATGEVELHLLDLGIAPPSVAGVVKVANRFRVSFEIHAHAAR
jgi:polyisoprenoid-binding protein YceI